MNTLNIASLCADALLKANLIKKEDFDKAEGIIEEEIRVRIALGDAIVINEGSVNNPLN